MDGEGSGEGFDGGEEALLESRDQEAGCTLRAPAFRRQALFPEGTVLVEQGSDAQFRCVWRQTRDVYLNDMTFREAADDLSQVVFEAAHHHVIQIAFDHLDAPAKALRIEQFEQRGETVRVAVVRGGGKEQTVLEPGARGLGWRG